MKTIYKTLGILLVIFGGLLILAGILGAAYFSVYLLIVGIMSIISEGITIGAIMLIAFRELIGAVIGSIGWLIGTLLVTVGLTLIE